MLLRLLYIEFYNFNIGIHFCTPVPVQVKVSHHVDVNLYPGQQNITLHFTLDMAMSFGVKKKTVAT